MQAIKKTMSKLPLLNLLAVKILQVPMTYSWDWYAALNSLPAPANMPHPHHLHPDTTLRVTTITIVIHPETERLETPGTPETLETEKPETPEKEILGSLCPDPGHLLQG
jgi:hypothetical protein